MARAIQSGSIPLAGSSDSDLAPRKETQTVTHADEEEQVNVKVSGGKRKKPALTPRRAAAAVGKELKEHLSRRNGNGEEESEGERVVKSRRLMSPAEALLDSAQAVVPAPGLHQRAGSVGGGRRSTTFTLRPPREGSVDARERSASPEKGRYNATRRHRTSQSPGMGHSFSAIVNTGTGMDTTIEEESGDSGETSGRAEATTSISVLHGESSYEVMEREVQLARSRNGRQAGFVRPQAIPEEPGRPFFPIPAQQPSTSGKRRTSRNTDAQAYRPLGGSSLPAAAAESTATDSADEDGGGVGLAAHLPDRSTRGKRQEHGEGYLGTGLAFTPGSAARGRKKDSGRLESAEGESAEEERAEDVKPRRSGAKFNTPARRKSASVSLSPSKEQPPRQQEPVKQRYRESLAVSPTDLGRLLR